MSRVKYLTLGCLLCVVAFSYVAPSSVSAQTTKPADSVQANRDQTLQELLTEVRELRLAVQRAMVSSSRFQMLIERLRVQQSHVDALSRQLESVRSQEAELKGRKPQMELAIKEAEDMLDRTPDPSAHADLESRIKEIKTNLAMLALEDDRLRGRETAIDTELQTAQSHLNELNNQLDLLMNGLKEP